MKKYLLLLLLFFTFYSSFSQTSVYHPFPDSSAIWTVGDNSWSPPIHGRFDKFFLSGDTIIDLIKYKKVYINRYNEYSIYVSFYIGAIRENNYKWMFIPNKKNEEKMLYNFNLQDSDTVTFFSYIDLLGLEEGYDPDSLTFFVVSIDSIIIGNTYRKTICLNMYDTIGNCEVWIEGIGSVNGLFYAGSNFGMDMGNLLLCFKENDSILYYNNYYLDACDDYSNINNPLQKNDFRIYPSIVNKNNSINIESNYENVSYLYIYDCLGNKSFYYEIFPKLITEIIMPKQGMFLYQIISKNNNIITGRFIVL